MNMEWLHCFVEIVNHKSLSKASERLNLTQPALSKQIRNLENYYQVQLFIRSTGGMELTEEGAILYTRILPILSELASLQQELENRTVQKTISIATLPSIAAYFLPKSILHLEKNGRKTSVNILAHSTQIIEELSQDKASIGILDNTVAIPKHFWVKNLFTEPYFVITPQAHPFNQKSSVTVKDLSKETLVVFPPSCDVRKSIERSYKEHQIIPKLSIEAQFGESILGLVSAGAGITILPEIAAKHIAQHALVARPIHDWNHHRTISLVARDARVGNMMYKTIQKQTE